MRRKRKRLRKKKLVSIVKKKEVKRFIIKKKGVKRVINHVKKKEGTLQK
jgi:hypothetical protein